MDFSTLVQPFITLVQNKNLFNKTYNKTWVTYHKWSEHGKWTLLLPKKKYSDCIFTWSDEELVNKKQRHILQSKLGFRIKKTIHHPIWHSIHFLQEQNVRRVRSLNQTAKVSSRKLLECVVTQMSAMSVSFESKHHCSYVHLAFDL